jgi:hypothetical protein
MVVTKKQHKFGSATEEAVLPPKNQRQKLHRHHELHLRFALTPPPYPLSTYSPGGEGLRWRIPNILPLAVGGNGLAIRQNPHSFSLTTPEKDRVCHPAVCNRYPASPRRKIALATGHGK